MLFRTFLFLAIVFSPAAQADQASALAAYARAENYFTSAQPDYKKAQEWYLKAAQEGHGHSQLRLGFLYSETHFFGAVTDYVEAEKWYLKAAEKNVGDARFRLAVFYNDVKSPPDPLQGAVWMKKAAEGGHRTAMFDLGRMYLAGKGVAKNIPLGLEWMEKAARLDLVQAQEALSGIYGEGQWVLRDEGKARMWAVRVADRPQASVFQLNRAADFLFKEKDYAGAEVFYRRAAEKHDHHALEALKQINSLK